MTHIDTDFQPAHYPPEAFDFHALMRSFRVTKAEAKRQVRRLKTERVARSGTHQVAINHVGTPDFPIRWLAIKRIDRSPILDRAELGRIAEALAPGQPALELLPLSERVVDTANSYHLFCLQGEGLSAFADGEWVLPPHLGDWRELQAWREAAFPDREGALVLAGPARVGEVLLAPQDVLFPFGFSQRFVIGESRGGAVQRPFGWSLSKNGSDTGA